MNSNSMVEQVNRLVGNLLAANSVVWLPDVGTLRVERQAARRLSRREVQPPVRLVNFSSQRSGESLVDAIARAARCDRAAADDIYMRWLSRVRTGEGLVMEGVGVLKFKNFTPDEAFDRRLNPQGSKPMRVHTPRRLDWSVWVGLVAALLAVGVVVYQFGLKPGTADRSAALRHESASVAGAAGDAVRSTAGASAPSAAATIDNGASSIASGDVAPAAPAETAPSAPALAADAASPSSAGMEKAEAKRKTPSAQAGEPVRMVSKRHYVVLGVYSTQENAERAAHLASEKEQALRCSVYRFGSKFMVSPFESDDVEAGRQFVRAYRSAFPEMWVYSAK